MGRTVVLLLSSLLATQAIAQGTRPNILFIMSDDHAGHAISAYGSVINRTPNLDRIAREGMLFRSAFVTNSICGPSRATILTGQFGHLNGVAVNEVPLHPDTLTFPKLLGAAGYQTAIIGKWHLLSLPSGFDHYEVLQGQGTYYNPRFFRQGDTTTIEGYTTDVITDRALSWLQTRRDSTRPFLLMYQHKAPHRAWDPGPDHLDLYRDTQIPEPPTLFDDYSGRASPARTQEMTVAHHLDDRDLKFLAPPELTPDQLARWNASYGPENTAFRAANLTGDALTRWKYQRYIKDYLRTVASVDDNVGRILRFLDESGLARNTIVVYTSDQGFYLGDHGWYDKRWMYEESMGTPLLVRWPGVVKAGSVNNDLVQNLDFAQTLLEAGGVAAPPTMQGRSLVPLLRGTTPRDWRDALYYQYFEYPGWHMVRRHYGVRTKRHKLIHYYEVGEWELFDLERDPREMRSVYADRGYATVVRDMKRRLNALRVQYREPEKDPVPYRKFPGK